MQAGCLRYGGGGVLHGSLTQRAGTVPEVFSFTPVRNVKKVRLNMRSNYGADTLMISEIGIVGRVVPPAGTIVLTRWRADFMTR